MSSGRREAMDSQLHMLHCFSQQIATAEKRSFDFKGSFRRGRGRGRLCGTGPETCSSTLRRSL